MTAPPSQPAARSGPLPGRALQVACSYCAEPAGEQVALSSGGPAEGTYMWLCGTHLERFLERDGGPSPGARLWGWASAAGARLTPGRRRSSPVPVHVNTPEGDARSARSLR